MVTKTKHIEYNIDYCVECEQELSILDTNTGDLICRNCGLIIESKMIDLRTEYRIFNKEGMEMKARLGAPESFSIHNKGLSTIVDRRDADCNGKPLNPHNRAEAYRLRKWQNRTFNYSSGERNISIALKELDRLTSYIGLKNSIKESAALIYRKAFDKKLLRGRSIDTMIAAALFIACRISSIPITMDNFENISRFNTKDLSRCIRILQLEFKFKIPEINPIVLISKIGTSLKISNVSQILARKYLNIAKKMGLIDGKDPKGLVAAALYIAGKHTGEHFTQSDISKIANITEVTLRNRYKELIKKFSAFKHPAFDFNFLTIS